MGDLVTFSNSIFCLARGKSKILKRTSYKVLSSPLNSTANKEKSFETKKLKQAIFFPKGFI